MGLILGLLRPPGTYFEFFGCMIGVSAGLYVFFLCRMLGAGDIKLMAVCAGLLGFKSGLWMIFCGLSLALLHYGIKYIRKGTFWGQKLRLAPYLFSGYCIWLAVCQVCSM